MIIFQEGLFDRDIGKLRLKTVLLQNTCKFYETRIVGPLANGKKRNCKFLESTRSKIFSSKIYVIKPSLDLRIHFISQWKLVEKARQ